MPILIRILLLAVLSGCASQPLSPVPVESRTRPSPVTPPPSAQRPATVPAPTPAAPVARAEPVRPSGVQVKPLASPTTVEKPASASAKEPPNGARRAPVEPQKPEARSAEPNARSETRLESSTTGAAESREEARPAPKVEPKPETRTESRTEAKSEAGFVWPARGKVIQAFSEPRNMGIAIAGNPGDPVQAVADGRVIFSGPGPRGYGNLVILKHDADTLSVYAHNRALLVKEGAQVRRGQQIAELGESGTDRPKLHFEIRRSGKPVDPVKLLPPR